MTKRFLLLSTVIFLFSSCLKTKKDTCLYTDSTFIAPAAEQNTLQGWISANHSGATKHPSGFFYEISIPGTGPVPAVCSNITVKYTGTLINGNKFDENTTGFSSVLGALILGWQRGVPLIKAGGTIILYLPPSFGYGGQDVKDNNGVVVIPANSILVFTIQLITVQ